MNAESQLIVRPVADTDHAALALLSSEVTGLETTAEQIGERLRRSSGVEHPVIAWLGEEAAGFASLRLLYYLGEDAPYAELTELYVRRDYRRQGVAQAMVEVLEAQAREAGATSWSVLTGDDNTAALAFYQSQGFNPFSIALQKWFSDERPYRL